MRSIIRNMAVVMLLLAMVGGGFVCMVSAGNMMDHTDTAAPGNLDTHLALASALNNGLIASVSVVLVSLFVLIFLPLFNTIDIGLALPSVSYSRQKWREPPGIIERCYSWLSLLVRSPGTMHTA